MKKTNRKLIHRKTRHSPVGMLARSGMLAIALVGLGVFGVVAFRSIAHPAEQGSGANGGFNPYYILRCSNPEGVCGSTKKVNDPCTFQKATNVSQSGTCVLSLPDIDNCPGGPSGPTCRDKFGVIISCKNTDQGDADFDLIGDICDNCSDEGANGVFSLNSTQQWNDAASGGFVAGTQQIVNTVACNDQPVLGADCTKDPLICGEGTYCDANDLRCSGDGTTSCTRDQDCQFAGLGRCAKFCHDENWCNDADGGLKLEKRVTPTPYIWLSRSTYDDPDGPGVGNSGGDDAITRIRVFDQSITDARDPSKLPNDFITVLTELIGNNPSRISVDLENELVWVGNRDSGTVSLLQYDEDPTKPATSIFQCPAARGTRGVALGGDGTAYVTGSGAIQSGWDAPPDGRLFVFTKDIPICPVASKGFSDFRAYGAAVDSKDVMWVSDFGLHKVHKIRLSDLRLLATINSDPLCAPGFGDWQGGGPYGITIDQFDNVWFSCWGGSFIANAELVPPSTQWHCGDNRACRTDADCGGAQWSCQPRTYISSDKIVKIDTNIKKACVADSDCYFGAGFSVCSAGFCDHVAQPIEVTPSQKIAQLRCSGSGNSCSDNGLCQGQGTCSATPLSRCLADPSKTCTQDTECPSVAARAGACLPDGSKKTCYGHHYITCTQDSQCPTIPSVPSKCGDGIEQSGRGVAVDLRNNVWFADSSAPGWVHELVYPYYRDLGACVAATGQCELGKCSISGAGCGVNADCFVYSKNPADTCEKPTCTASDPNSCNYQKAYPVGYSPIGVAVDSNDDIWVVNNWGYERPNAPMVDLTGLIPPDPTPAGGSVTKLIKNANGAYEDVTYRVGGGPYTYSDMAGLQRGLLVRTGAWEASFDSRASNTLWHRLALDAFVYQSSKQRVTVQLNAAEDPSEFGKPDEKWDVTQAVSESGLADLNNLSIVGRFLHVKLNLRSSERDSSPVVRNLTINFGRCTAAQPNELVCDNNVDDDGDGYVDCADFDCANQTDSSGGICCGNASVSGFKDNNLCGACSLCGNNLKEDGVYSGSKGANGASDVIYRCAPQADTVEGNKCTGPCTQCSSGSCVNRADGDQAECGVSCFACGPTGGGCTVPLPAGSDPVGPGLCGSGKTCDGYGLCATIVEACTDGTDNDGDELADCSDPDCWGQDGPGGVRCCWNSTSCPNNGQCYTCDQHVCNPTSAAEGNACTGACTSCVAGSCQPYGDGAQGECGAGLACSANACRPATGTVDGICTTGESSVDCQTEAFCADGVNNDANRESTTQCVDDADVDCGGLEDDCGDGIDNDCDGRTDGQEPECGNTSCGTNIAENAWNVAGCNACLVAGDQDGDQPGSWPASPLVGGRAPVDQCDASCGIVNTTVRAVEYQAGAETSCDNIDNDCDGQVDETATCPAGQTCQNGTCGIAAPPPAPAPKSIDNTPPTLAFSTPANGSYTTAASLAFSGTASDDSALARVVIRLNGGAEQDATGTTAWSQTLSLTEGANTIEAQAEDAAGNRSAVVSRTVVRDTTAPTIAIATPAPGSVPSSPLTVSGTSADANPFTVVILRVNLGSWSIVSGSSNWTGSVNLRVGTNRIDAQAIDVAGNLTTATVYVVYSPPDTTAPTVSLTAPSAGTVSGSIAVSANASDDLGLAGVRFYLDDVAMAVEGTTSPFSINWDTRGTPDGTHQLRADARDLSGNITASSVVTVTVQNSAKLTIAAADSRYPGNCQLNGTNWQNSCCQNNSAFEDASGNCLGHVGNPTIDKVFDGNGAVTNMWCSAQYASANYSDWITVNLGAVRQLTGVLITQPSQNNPYDCTGAANYTIETSTDGTNFLAWATPVEDTNATFTTVDIKKPLPTAAQYVRYRATLVVDNQAWNFAISEFEAYGY